MEISFKTSRLQKTFNNEKKLFKAYSNQRAKLIQTRMAELYAAECLNVFWPPKSKPTRCHELTGKQQGIFSVDLDFPYRLLFVPVFEKKGDITDEAGNYCWTKITSIEITSIENTHGK